MSNEIQTIESRMSGHRSKKSILEKEKTKCRPMYSYRYDVEKLHG
jgi:hypothetical protein